jgi:hypothetical protein
LLLAFSLASSKLAVSRSSALSLPNGIVVLSSLFVSRHGMAQTELQPSSVQHSLGLGHIPSHVIRSWQMYV